MYITLRSKIKYYIEKYGERPLGARRYGGEYQYSYELRSPEYKRNPTSSLRSLRISQICSSLRRQIIFSDTINGFKYFIKVNIWISQNTENVKGLTAHTLYFQNNRYSND